MITTPEPQPLILAVDDEPNNLILLQRMLKRYFEVITASNGSMALTTLNEVKVDVLLLDVMMPGMSGLDVLREIRQNPETADLPVILISAMAEARDVAHGLELGANDYITKPIDPEVTLARIQTQLALKQLQDERKKTIQGLRAAQQMKERLLRIASHDLKNPLMNIRMVTELIDEALPSSDDHRLLIDTLSSSLDAMQTVIEDFLDTAAVDMSEIDIRFSSVDVELVITDLLKLYTAHAQKKGIQLLHEPTHERVRADQARFSQALGNLVSNAIKYSPLSSKIHIWAVLEAGVVQICIADEGPGILPEDQDRLFTQFGKLSARPTGGETSTGLGLWIVKHLITLQGGEVGVECPTQGGSIFWIKIPTANSDLVM
ncbi:MAG: hybrid sensor histidine kinase/response regulator [Anaerolineae bacterium]|nr:hybrid sensor histidine kinase/response regulator [Anaerolineae bacterium]